MEIRVIGAWADAPPDVAPGDGTISDSDLLVGCRAGDRAAWDRLVSRYERLLFSVAMRNGLSREDAADVTQTTFIALLDSIMTIREDEKLASWLMTVARRHAWRMRRREPQASLQDDTVMTDEIVDWEQVADLHDGLRQLGSPCQDLLHALYFDPREPSYAQVASRLGRAVGSLGPLRARCLTKLRAILGEDAWAS